MLIVFQALFLGLGSTVLSPLGGAMVSAIGGLLTSAWRAPFAPFTLGFAVLYGLLVNAFLMLFKVKTQKGTVQVSRLSAGATIARALTGMASYYTTVYVVPFLSRNIVLEAAILLIGVLNGLAGGYLAGLLWNKALRHLLRYRNLDEKCPSSDTGYQDIFWARPQLTIQRQSRIATNLPRVFPSRRTRFTRPSGRHRDLSSNRRWNAWLGHLP